MSVADRGGRRLVLVRHAKAAPAADEHAEGGDAARPLTDRGRDQAAATAAWLVDQGLAAPDLALVSPALRTGQTWQVMSAVVDAGTARTEDDLYLTSAQGLVAMLAELPDEVASVVVVGHEPVVSGTASALSGDPALAVGVRPGTAVVLAAPVWSELGAGSCELLAVGPQPAGSA